MFHKILFCIQSSIPVHSYRAHGSLLLSRNYHSERFTITFVNCCGSSVSQMTTYIFCLSFRSTWVRPLFCSCLSGVCVVHVVKLYHVINSVLWCQVPFPCKSDVRFVSTLNSLVGGSFRYLFYLWCVTYSGVQHDFMLSEFLLFYL